MVIVMNDNVQVGDYVKLPNDHPYEASGTVIKINNGYAYVELDSKSDNSPAGYVLSMSTAEHAGIHEQYVGKRVMHAPPSYFDKIENKPNHIKKSTLPERKTGGGFEFL